MQRNSDQQYQDQAQDEPRGWWFVVMVVMLAQFIPLSGCTFWVNNGIVRPHPTEDVQPMETKPKRTGRLSLRMTPEFIELCAQTAAKRGQTLTEFTQQAMILNLTRTPMALPVTADE